MPAAQCPPAIHSRRKAFQHNVDNYSGDRNIQPNRKRPSGDSPVDLKLIAQGKPKCSQNERKRNHREPDMGNQNEKVYRADPPVTRKYRVSVEKVVSHIRRQK